MQLLDEWRKYWEETSLYCEQRRLTADTNGIIVEFLEKKIQEAHLDRMEYFRSVLLQAKTRFVDSEMGVLSYLKTKIENDTNIIKLLVGKEKIEISPEIDGASIERINVTTDRQDRQAIGMKKAELQYSKHPYPSDPLGSVESVDVHKTLEHLVEVINEMQDKLDKFDNKV